MKRFLLRRFLLAILTLFLLTGLVFFATHALPGNVAQKILGPFADKDAVKLLNHQLGTDRPIPTQYVNWLGDTLSGDLGQSLNYDVPVTRSFDRPLAIRLGWRCWHFSLSFPSVFWVASSLHFARTS
jgi:ABC-type dipeptide/oligopeptide/nickel transport system permease component